MPPGSGRSSWSGWASRADRALSRVGGSAPRPAQRAPARVKPGAGTVDAHGVGVDRESRAPLAHGSRPSTLDRLSVELRAAMRVMGPRSTAWVAVVMVWTMVLAGSVAGLMRGSRLSLLFLLPALVGLALVHVMLALPVRWLPPVYSMIALVAPLLVYGQIVAAPDPMARMITGTQALVIPVFAFMLWGRWLGSGVSAIVAGTYLLTGFQHQLPASFVSALVQVVLFSGVMLGWAAYRRDRLESDPVTGLPNRAALERAVEDELARAGTGRQPCLVVIDVDGVRHLNREHGRSAGDQLLRRTAAALGDRLPDHARAFHLGSGEFAVVLPDPGSATAEVVEALRTEVVPDGTASAGLAVAQPEDTPALLLARAESSLGRAKTGGRDRLDPLLSDLSAVHELRSALDHGQFTVLFQPVVELADGRTVGAEALVRWDHPLRGRIIPDVFIPLAEEAGVIHELGRFVLTQACATVAGADLRGRRLGRLSVNASVVELQHPEFADGVLEVLAETGLDPRRLVLEVTESAVGAESGTAAGALSRLRGHGVQVAIDDFGTGYSSLSRLGRLPVDILKIDKSFVWAGEGTERDSVLEAIVSLAEVFGLSTVAEGIETWDHAELLARLGCRYGQGYLFGRPGQFEDLDLAVGAVPAPRGPVDGAATRAEVPRT
jgi:diguanylate cyclase